MIRAPRKKLIEVALPLEAINRESARRKRKAPGGYPTTLHKWWAQRPLAACRAVLFASLVDDPDSDPAYAENHEAAGEKRARLFGLIEELVLWENSTNPKVINQARAEIARCVASRKIELGELAPDATISPTPLPTQPRVEVEDTTPNEILQVTGGKRRSETAVKGKVRVAADRHAAGTQAKDIVAMMTAPEAVNAFLAEYAPPVLDPFCGGGSIPLEAQRLGLRAFASDLNPVPVLITKAMIEIPPVDGRLRTGQRWALHNRPLN